MAGKKNTQKEGSSSDRESRRLLPQNLARGFRCVLEDRQ